MLARAGICERRHSPRGIRSSFPEAIAEWMPELLAEGRDPCSETPPAEWWTAQRHELTDGFLAGIAAEYLRLGCGYAPVLAARDSTSVRTGGLRPSVAVSACGVS